MKVSRNNMFIDYRILKPDESLSYRAIRLESLEQFPEFFGEKYADALKIPKFFMEEVIQKPILEMFAMGAFVVGELSGICVFIRQDSGVGNIYQMYVKAELQGNNIGFGLIKATLEEAQCRFANIEIFLEVAKENGKAFKLYQKVGFSLYNDREAANTWMMRYQAK